MKTLTWQKPGQQNVAQELIKIIINYVAELRIYNKKFDFKDVPTLPEFYIVPSKYVVENRTKYDLKSGGERFNIFKKDIKDYINRWDLLKKR